MVAHIGGFKNAYQHALAVEARFAMELRSRVNIVERIVQVRSQGAASHENMQQTLLVLHLRVLAPFALRADLPWLEPPRANFLKGVLLAAAVGLAS